MFPKEHGAWNVLLVSLAAGWLTLGHWTGPAFAATLIWFSAFILRAPLSTARQYRIADPPKAKRALVFSLLLAVIFTGSVWFFWNQAPRESQQLFLLAAAPLGSLLFVLALVRRSLRILWAELLGFAFLTLGAPVLYLTGPSASFEAACLLYIMLAGYFIISIFYVRIRLAWWHGYRAGENRTSFQRMGDLKWVLAAGALWVIVVFNFPGAGPWQAAAPLAALGRILAGALTGRTDLPMMRLGLREAGQSIVFLVLALVGWK